MEKYKSHLGLPKIPSSLNHYRKQGKFSMATLSHQRVLNQTDVAISLGNRFKEQSDEKKRTSKPEANVE
jgi:hypothetical protein